MKLQDQFGVLLSPASVQRLSAALTPAHHGESKYEQVTSLRLRRPYQTTVQLRPATNDLITLDEMFVTKLYEPVIHLLPEAETVIDLGANIGFASIYFLSVYPICKVIALEPDTRNFDLLQSNLQPYERRGRSKAVQGAFWKQEGMVVLERSEDQIEVNKGAVRSEPPSINSGNSILVRGLTLETIVAESGFEKIDLLKVDIEGGERHLFSGDLTWLTKVQCMAHEFHGQAQSIRI